MNPFDKMDNYEKWLRERPCLDRIDYASHEDGRWSGYLYRVTVAGISQIYHTDR